MDTINKPTWLQVSAFVRVMGWCGQITEIAVSEQQLYVRIVGAKSIFHGNTGGDFIPFDPSAITPVTRTQAAENYAVYLKQAQTKVSQITDMLNALTPSPERERVPETGAVR